MLSFGAQRIDAFQSNLALQILVPVVVYVVYQVEADNRQRFFWELARKFSAAQLQLFVTDFAEEVWLHG